MRIIRRFLLSLLLCLYGNSFAVGDPHAGEAKALTCNACHGAHGVSVQPLWPNLAGQHASYLLQQLKLYQEGKARKNPMMSPMVGTLSAQDMEDLAAFYAKQPVAPAKTEKADRALGEHLYRLGDNSKQIPACIACHGPDGRGAAHAGFPMISHQQSDYLIQQLQAFKTAERTSDPMQIMRSISSKLSDKEMQAVGHYLETLE
ncbi:MAG: cytochrome c4 [Gammaproteobacteria bacterium]|nr:cytochrome c4 [Gammaproteobacteria bacterium]